MTLLQSSEDDWFIAVVGAQDGIRLTAIARSREALLARVADYVAGRAEFELPPATAATIREQLAAGDDQAAIHLYFTPGAHRWNEEWLHLGATTEAGGAAASGAGFRGESAGEGA